MSSYNTRDLIDNELLIEEVRIRPGLYDRLNKDYNDHVLKKKLWEEVTQNVIGEYWPSMSDAEREVRVNDVIKRWNNLRTCFTRRVKKLRDPLTNSKTRKYLYYDQLVFLLDPNTAQNLEEEQETESITNQPKNPKTKNKTNKRNKIKKLEQFVQKSIEKIKQATDNVEKSITTDADTNFALSLVPLLKMVPMENKIKVQIDILNVINRYANHEVIIKQELEMDESNSDGESLMDLSTEETD